MPEKYSELFRQLDVFSVVRLNKEHYDSQIFTNNGISFYDLYFLDGSVPSNEIIEEFLKIVESSNSAIAVHCKAGLGRTGTLIGCYAIKNYNFTGAEFIGWARLCRPGSVLGPQQYFLCEYYENINYAKKSLNQEVLRSKSPQFEKRGEMTLFEKYKAKFGELGQSEKLTQSLKFSPSSPNIGNQANNLRIFRIQSVRDLKNSSKEEKK